MKLLNDDFWVSRYLQGKYLPKEQTKLLNKIKEKYYQNNLFDYADFSNSDEFREMQSLSAALKIFNLNELDSENKKTAFWLNTFNMLVLNAVTLEYPIKKINTKLFAESSYQVGYEAYSLDDIEHGLLRANSGKSGDSGEYFKKPSPKKQFCLKTVDPRLHFLFYSACKGSAALAFLDEDAVTEQVSVTVRTELSRTIKIEKNKISVPKFFKWYEPDFGGKNKIKPFIETFASDDLKNQLSEIKDTTSIKYNDFDWSINA